MEQLKEKTKHPCWAEYECYYKVNDTCTFQEQVKTILSRLQEEHHKGASCCLDLIDIFQERCLELDNEGHKRGIGNVLGFRK